MSDYNQAPTDPHHGGKTWECAASRQGTIAGDVTDCDWPMCGCDEKADKVLETLIECGWVGPENVSFYKAKIAAVKKEQDELRGKSDALLDAAIIFMNNCDKCYGSTKTMPWALLIEAINNLKPLVKLKNQTANGGKDAC